jgi:predicted anti-sigma-YlaC factor YlaD
MSQHTHAHDHRDHVNCKALVELVTDYLEGALDPVVATRFEEHLIMCQPCNVYLDQMRSIRQAGGPLSEESLPEETRAGLVEAFRGWKGA